MSRARATDASSSNMSRGQRFLIAVALLFTVLSAISQFAVQAAYADAMVPAESVSNGGVPQRVPAEDVNWRQALSTNPCSAGLYPPMDNLPVVRWSNSSNEFHIPSDLSAWDIGGQMSQLMRNVTGGMSMVMGNGLFGFTTQIVEGATVFCPLNEFGAKMDGVAATVGTAIISSPLLLIAGIVLVIAYFMSRMRGDGAHTVASLLKKALAVVLLVIITIGASASTSPSPGVYKPGTMSPGWLMLNVDRVTSALSSTLVSVFPTSVVEVTGPTHLDDDLSCVHYVKAMNEQYEAQMDRSMGGSGMGPSMVSRLWETSGLRAWQEAQFGANPYADVVACRMLEANSHKSMWVAAGGPGADGPSIQNFQNAAFALAGNTRSHMPATPRPLFKTSPGGKFNAAVMVVFASCKLNDNGNIADVGAWGLRSPELLPPQNRGKFEEAQRRCHSLFNASELDEQDLDFFKWGGGKDQITENVTDPAVLDFLLTLHAHGGMTNAMTLGMFFIGAIAVLFVIGGMGAGLFLAKMATVLIGLALMLMLLWSLFGRNGDKKVLEFAKQYIGMSFFVFAFGLLLGIVALVASMVADISTVVFPSGGIGAVAIVALSPVIAAVLVKMLFKKVGLPNPLSISGGLAFANAARSMSPDGLGDAGAGGAAGALDRGQRRAGSKAKRLGGAAAKGLLPARFRPRSGNTAEAAITGGVAGLMAGGASNAVSGLIKKRGESKFDSKTRDVEADGLLEPTDGAPPALAAPDSGPEVGTDAAGAGAVPKRGIPAEETQPATDVPQPRPFETEEQRWERVRLENEHAAASKKARDARADLEFEQLKRNAADAEAALHEPGPLRKATAALGKAAPVAEKVVLGTALSAAAVALPGGIFAVGAYGAWKAAKGVQAGRHWWKNRDASKAQRQLTQAEQAAELVERQQKAHDARVQLEAQKKLRESIGEDGATPAAVGPAGAAPAGSDRPGDGRRNTSVDALDPARVQAAEQQSADREVAELEQRTRRPQVNAPTGGAISSDDAGTVPVPEGGGEVFLEETRKVAGEAKAASGEDELRGDSVPGRGSWGMESPQVTDTLARDEGGQA